MKFMYFASAIVACALLSNCSMARASSQSGLGGPTSLSVGLFWPDSDEASENGGSTQFMADLRYNVQSTNHLQVPAQTVFDVGVEAGADHGGHSTIVPIMIGEQIGTSNQSPLAPGSFYLGAGIGLAIVDQTGESNGPRFAADVNAGYNFNTSTFGELKYQFVDNGNGPMASIGFSFK
jgi:hypothetical protein